MSRFVISRFHCVCEGGGGGGDAEAEEQPFYHFFIIHVVFVSLTK